jgi:hypothetical protein
MVEYSSAYSPLENLSGRTAPGNHDSTWRVSLLFHMGYAWRSFDSEHARCSSKLNRIGGMYEEIMLH